MYLDEANRVTLISKYGTAIFNVFAAKRRTGIFRFPPASHSKCCDTTVIIQETLGSFNRVLRESQKKRDLFPFVDKKDAAGGALRYNGFERFSCGWR